jgi:hypothetical protein
MPARERPLRSRLGLSRSASQALVGGDFRSGNAIVEAVAGPFWLTLLLVVICQLADLVTFNVAVRIFGPSGELGPLGMVYQMGGFWAVALVKLSLITIVATVLVWYPWHRLRTRRNVALLVGIVGLFGALTNVLAFAWLG